jgi:hypothetical protein
MKVVCCVKNRMTQRSTKSNCQQSWRCNGLITWNNCITIPQGANNSILIIYFKDKIILMW